MTKSIKKLMSQAENQIFDRKSFLIDPKNLAMTIVAFANADGGDIVLGVEDDGRVVGVDNNPRHLNELLRAPLDYCVPSINIGAEYIACKDYEENKNHLYTGACQQQQGDYEGNDPGRDGYCQI